MIINLGDTPFEAFITVTYPSGTCTVSLGGKSFTHSGGGTHTFTVNKKGAWTVAATSASGLTKTQTVNITTRNQTVSVSLAYRQYLYLNGEEYTSITGGWVIAGAGAKNSTSITVQGPGSYYTSSAATNNAIDLTGYRTLNFNVISSEGEESQTSISAGTASIGIYGTGVKTLDISGVNGSYQVKLSIAGTSGVLRRKTFNEVWIDV